MKLNVLDRILIPQFLPSENSFMDFNLKREITKKVSLSESDIEKYEIKENKEANRTEWNLKKDFENPVEVDFSRQELDYLKNACEKMTETPAPDSYWVTVEKIYAACNQDN